MSLNDWILSLHLLSAFALVAGLVLFWILVVAVRRTDTAEGTIHMEPLGKVGNATVGVGSVGTIVFGIWLALSVGGYKLWDGWIVAAIVLWAISLALGRQTGVAYMQGMNKAQELQTAGQTESNTELLALNRTTRGLALHAVTSAVVLLILIDMIWKPGA